MFETWYRPDKGFLIESINFTLSRATLQSSQNMNNLPSAALPTVKCDPGAGYDTRDVDASSALGLSKNGLASVADTISQREPRNTESLHGTVPNDQVEDNGISSAAEFLDTGILPSLEELESYMRSRGQELPKEDNEDVNEGSEMGNATEFEEDVHGSGSEIDDDEDYDQGDKAGGADRDNDAENDDPPAGGKRKRKASKIPHDDDEVNGASHSSRQHKKPRLDKQADNSRGNTWKRNGWTTKSNSASTTKRRGGKKGNEILSNLRTSNLEEWSAANQNLPDAPTFSAQNRRDIAIAKLIRDVEDRNLPKSLSRERLNCTARLFGPRGVISTNDGLCVRGMKSALMVFQLLGVEFLVNRESDETGPRGGILADDMGYGSRFPANLRKIMGYQANVPVETVQMIGRSTIT